MKDQTGPGAAITCAVCGAVNKKTARWNRNGGADFDCEKCGALIHVDSANWYEGSLPLKGSKKPL